MSLGQRLARLAVADLSPLRVPDYRRLFVGHSVTLLGNQVTAVAVPYQLYRQTGSPLAVGLLGLAEVGPLLAFAFLGGALADARDRRRLLLLAEVGQALLAVALVANAVLEGPPWVIYALTVGQASCYAIQRPALSALLPRLVPREQLAAATALWTVGGTTAMLLGPALGGGLIALTGLPLTYTLDVLTFGVSLLLFTRMPPVPPPADAERPSLRRVAEGLAYARQRPELIGTYVVDLIAMFFGMPLALFPAIADRLGGPGVLGLLYSAPAFGAFVATSTSGWTRHVQRHGLAVILAATGWGVAILLFGLTDVPALALLLLAAAGGADAISGIFRNTIWNQTIPDALRGRLASIEMLSYSLGPHLGNAEAGLVASMFSVPASIVSGGVLCVLGCVLAGAALPAFRAYRPAEHRTVTAEAA